MRISTSLRQAPWTLHALLMAGAGSIHAMPLGHVNGITNLGVGNPLPDFNGTPLTHVVGYTEHKTVFGASRGAIDAEACKAICDDAALTHLPLRGFSFFGDESDTSANICRCWSGGAGDFATTDGSTVIGQTYCYGCQEKESTSQKGIHDDNESPDQANVASLLDWNTQKGSDEGFEPFPDRDVSSNGSSISHSESDMKGDLAAPTYARDLAEHRRLLGTPSPSKSPSKSPTSPPSKSPTSPPSKSPTSPPSKSPTSPPSKSPTSPPSKSPTSPPSKSPTSPPSKSPTSPPSKSPTISPTSKPSVSISPSSIPSESPSRSGQPSSQPSMNPSVSNWPSSIPSESPSVSTQPSISSVPTSQPSMNPSVSIWPTSIPSSQPSAGPSRQPSGQPSGMPSGQPSNEPSRQPSGQPSAQPSSHPSTMPSGQPSGQPSAQPSTIPSSEPSRMPSSEPSRMPSSIPSSEPSRMPSSIPSSEPSRMPSSEPSRMPSSIPSSEPSRMPSTIPSSEPSRMPSSEPSRMPSSIPSSEPSRQPSSQPSRMPSSIPSSEPSRQPSSQPSRMPSSIPSSEPSRQPSSQPSRMPSSMPSEAPSSQPSSMPSAQPSSQPSESPSANPSQGCENIRTDCGWGIFNPWTCRCDCPVGICLDNNDQCYFPCAETIHTNPWAGCSPGWDCPWFPDTQAGYCKSELHQPNHFEIYRTSNECCKAHFSSSSSCLEKSKSLHDPFPWPIHFPGTPEHRPFAPPVAEDHWGTEASHRNVYFPDLINKLNCVWGNNYENWMQDEGFAPYYLFSNATECCTKWYPARGSSCPDNERAVNPEAEDEPWHSNPYSMDNYFFPDFSRNSCGFGWDYPAWMGYNNYEKHYLFRTGEECCSKYFPMVSGCPYEDTLQLDYFWTSYEDNIYNLDDMPIIYNHTYYPDINAGTCVNGTDYPAWMASDRDFKRLYLFKRLSGCCKQWFTDWDLEGCMNSVIQGKYEVEPCPTNRIDCNFTAPLVTNVTEVMLEMWYPDIEAHRCKNDKNMPDWMLIDGYTIWYLFNTKAQCCAAFGLC